MKKEITKEQMEKFREYLNTPKKFEDMQLTPNNLKLVALETDAKFHKGALNIIMSNSSNEILGPKSHPGPPGTKGPIGLNISVGYAIIENKENVHNRYKHIYEFLKQADSYIFKTGKIERNNLFKDYALYCYKNSIKNDLSKEDIYEYTREYYFDKYGHGFDTKKEFFDSIKATKKQSWSERNE